MKSNFKIECPFCDKKHDLYEHENWDDEYKDDCDSTLFECECEKELCISTDLIIILSVDIQETNEINETI